MPSWVDAALKLNAPNLPPCLQERTGLTVELQPCGLLVHPEHPYLSASLDRWYTNGSGAVTLVEL